MHTVGNSNLTLLSINNLHRPTPYKYLLQNKYVMFVKRPMIISAFSRSYCTQMPKKLTPSLYSSPPIHEVNLPKQFYSRPFPHEQCVITLSLTLWFLSVFWDWRFHHRYFTSPICDVQGRYHNCFPFLKDLHWKQRTHDDYLSVDRQSNWTRKTNRPTIAPQTRLAHNPIHIDIKACIIVHIQ